MGSWFAAAQQMMGDVRLRQDREQAMQSSARLLKAVRCPSKGKGSAYFCASPKTPLSEPWYLCYRETSVSSLFGLGSTLLKSYHSCSV